jgi:hypothetical protein
MSTYVDCIGSIRQVTFRESAVGVERLPAGAPARTKESLPMLDVFMLVIGIGFFALSVAYALACDRL